MQENPEKDDGRPTRSYKARQHRPCSSGALLHCNGVLLPAGAALPGGSQGRRPRGRLCSWRHDGNRSSHHQQAGRHHRRPRSTRASAPGAPAAGSSASTAPSSASRDCCQRVSERHAPSRDQHQRSSGPVRSPAVAPLHGGTCRLQRGLQPEAGSCPDGTAHHGHGNSNVYGTRIPGGHVLFVFPLRKSSLYCIIGELSSASFSDGLGPLQDCQQHQER